MEDGKEMFFEERQSGLEMEAVYLEEQDLVKITLYDYGPDDDVRIPIYLTPAQFDALMTSWTRTKETSGNWNEMAVIFEDVLSPQVRQTLERGFENYGNVWKEHIHTGDLLEDVKHVVDLHVQARLLEALIALDRQDINGFEEKMASAVGYICNAIAKARYISRTK
jgi:hypothetical protein